MNDRLMSGGEQKESPFINSKHNESVFLVCDVTKIEKNIAG